MSAEDKLAVCMLLVLLIAAGTLTTILVSLMRNAGRKDELAELLKDEELVIAACENGMEE